MTKNQFLNNWSYSWVHIITTKELQEIRNTLKYQDFEILFDTLYQFYNFSSYTFTFKKQDFILDQINHLNFQVEIDS